MKSAFNFKLIYCLVFFITFVLEAQTFNKGFNFSLPYSDTSSSSFISLYPGSPIGEQDFISVDKEGHFSTGGKRIKFWGANLVAGGAFPDTDKAWYVAGRLRKMGFNLIRFHHMDNPWGNESLFQYGQDTRHLNPVTLNKLEYLIAKLKRNGIYANINLNVSRGFNSKDGVAGADSVNNMFKGVTVFDPQLISLEKEYAKQLLTTVNPYTGLALVNDPVMAMVEVINENSLYRMWRDGQLKPITAGGELLSRHSYMLDTMWISYLKNKYFTNAILSTAWNTGTTGMDGPNLIENGNFENPFNQSSWLMELHESAQASMTRDSSTSNGGKYSAKILVSSVTGTSWHIQWKQIGFSLKKDSTYKIIFAAKADKPGTINVSVMRDNSPYTFYNGQNFSVGTQWALYSFIVKPPEDNSGNGRLSFQFNNQTGNYWFDDISMNLVADKGLLPDENLDAGNVKRIDYSDCPQFSSARVKDMSEFYIKLQTGFFNDMKSYLHDTLGVKVPVVGTNWNIGAGDLISQSVMDYIDNHSYWDHPSFPNIPWSATDWYIQNQPMVKSVSGGTIPGLFGGVGIAGKPFTVSEYNHAYPNIYQTEGVLFLAAYSALQDIDGIMFFDYEGSENSWSNDFIQGYFDLDRNSPMMSLMPSCSFAFRNGLISKALQTVLLNYTRDTVLILPKTGSGYAPLYFSQKLALIHEVRNESFHSTTSSDFSNLNPSIDPPYISDTKEITYNTSGLLTVNAGNFIAASGFLNDFPDLRLRNFKIKTADGFGTITWLSLTGDSLEYASRSLLTVSTIQQNSGMIWDGSVTVHNNWGTSPTIINPLSLNIELNVYADSLKIFPLNIYGKADSGKYELVKSTDGIFNFSLDQNTEKTLWYGIESFGKGNATKVAADDDPAAIKDYKLEQNYPNPFNPSTIIKYKVGRTRDSNMKQMVSLIVYNVLGRKIATLVNEEKSAGTYGVEFNTQHSSIHNQLPSGVYFYQLRAGSYVETKKMLLLK